MKVKIKVKNRNLRAHVEAVQLPLCVNRYTIYNPTHVNNPTYNWTSRGSFGDWDRSIPNVCLAGRIREHSFSGCCVDVKDRFNAMNSFSPGSTTKFTNGS